MKNVTLIPGPSCIEYRLILKINPCIEKNNLDLNQVLEINYRITPALLLPSIPGREPGCQNYFFQTYVRGGGK
jgi:hypothetical protein